MANTSGSAVPTPLSRDDRGHTRLRFIPSLLTTALLASSCGDVSIQASPALFPAFDPSISDYVTRCNDQPVQVTVSGSAKSALVDGEVVAVGSSASVPLRSGEAFEIRTLTGHGRLSSYSVRCLPTDFPEFSVERSAKPQAEWYITAPTLGAAPAGASPHYVAIFDDHGVPVWWFKGEGNPLVASLFANGNLGWLRHTNPLAEERGFDGSLVRTLSAVGQPLDDHEFIRLKNGNYALASLQLREAVNIAACESETEQVVDILDHDLQEISPAGDLIWRWNVSEHIALSEVDAFWKPQCWAGDPYHFNSLEEDGDGFIASFRHLNAIYKISRSTGQIVWKLGGTQRPESLTVLGVPASETGAPLFHGQHDARMRKDRTLTLHDNRSYLTDGVPRALRFAIDEDAMTATRIESVTDETISTSRCCGGARKLSRGNWVVAWGMNTNFAELTPGGSPVLRVTFPGLLFTHRAVPLEPGELSRQTLVKGMNAQHPRTATSDEATDQETSVER